MRTPDDRWADLAAAALAGELSEKEAAEFEDLRRADPARAREFAELDALTRRLRQGDLTWTTPRDTGDLGTRIEASLAREEGVLLARDAAGSRPRRRWVLPAVAAACLAVGLVVGLTGPGVLSPVPAGPPGTLGAVEAVEVSEDAGGIAVDADVVAHTWGTEAYLEAEGLTVGATYELVFVGADGGEFSAGEILGSEVPIVCRMNAAVLREDAVRMELRDNARTVVAHADLPTV
ncbi:hypothetical protein ACFWZW_04495 [Microbacterium enclense]|uniref:hypothetical protein n=1 Tax=Microbacterium enclense TaxID=993073 RepID=UPI0036D88814